MKGRGSVKALARGYEYMMGLILFTPVAILALSRSSRPGCCSTKPSAEGFKFNAGENKQVQLTVREYISSFLLLYIEREQIEEQAPIAVDREQRTPWEQTNFLWS